MTTRQNTTASVATMNMRIAATWRMTPVPFVKILRVSISMDNFVRETASANAHSIVTIQDQTFDSISRVEIAH